MPAHQHAKDPTPQLRMNLLVLCQPLPFAQLPHFLSLAWLCQTDYAAGGFRMLPSIDPTGARTAAVALRHCAALAPLGAVAAALGVTSGWFAGEAAALAGVMAAAALSFRAAPSPATARRLFRASLLYLPALLVCLTAHRLPNTAPVSWGELADRGRAALDAAADALPELLAPGALWRSLSDAAGSLHAPRLRPLEERYAMLLEVQRQLSGVRCPSRAYGDAQPDRGTGDAESAESEPPPPSAAPG